MAEPWVRYACPWDGGDGSPFSRESAARATLRLVVHGEGTRRFGKPSVTVRDICPRGVLRPMGPTLGVSQAS